MKKILVVIVLLLSTSTFACSCIHTEFGKKDYVNADNIVKGKVLKVVYDEEAYEKVITFKVYKSYKDNSDKIIEIRTGKGDGDCGLPVNNDDKWLLFIYSNDQKNHVSLCSKNVRYNKRPNQSKESREVECKKMKSYIKKLKNYRDEE